jgi:hypothetical protein
MKIVQKIVVQKNHDRYVFLTYQDEELIGLNFHMGVADRDFKSFIKPCENLTSIYHKQREKHYDKNFSEKKLVNLSLKKYIKKYILTKEKRKVKIPKSQKELIQKAIEYYLKAYVEFNTNPGDAESHEIFDLKQLNAILNYKIIISINEEDIESFASNNGIDFPEYTK